MKFTPKQISFIQRGYELRRVIKNGHYYLNWIRADNGRVFKSVRWGARAGVTKRTATTASDFYLPMKPSDAKQTKLKTGELEVISYTWEERNPDAKADSVAYMEVRIVMPSGEKLPRREKAMLDVIKERLSKRDFELVKLWSEVFERHGVSPERNEGVTTEEPRVQVTLDVHKQKFRKVNKEVTEWF
jgi:hypothetical protein